MVVHAEIWLTKSGELIPCEIASRTGGSLIAKNIKRARCFDLNEIWVKAQVGLPWQHLIDHARDFPALNFTGFVLMPPKVGTLVCVADDDLPPYVDEYRLLMTPGKRSELAQKQADCLATFLASADDEASMRERLFALATWFDERAIWEEMTP